MANTLKAAPTSLELMASRAWLTDAVVSGGCKIFESTPSYKPRTFSRVHTVSALYVLYFQHCHTVLQDHAQPHSVAQRALL